nr:hypothetical protein GCM10020093_037410 [Planobispora longispora]
MAAGRLRAAWRAAHAPVPGVPGWARIAAYAVPLAVLPSGLWRLPLVFRDGVGFGERAYIVSLSVVSELAAFAAVGLIAAWGSGSRGGSPGCAAAGCRRRPRSSPRPSAPWS